MDRISFDEYYVNIAKAVSKRSSCLKRKYGCVIVNHNEIISTGYNGSAKGEINCCDLGHCSRLEKPHNSGDYSDCPAVHAEQNAMLSASRKEMIGSTMYIDGEEIAYIDKAKQISTYVQIEKVEPCPICLRMIKNSGIERIVTHNGIIWERK